jgi:hypothetical protein
MGARTTEDFHDSEINSCLLTDSSRIGDVNSFVELSPTEYSEIGSSWTIIEDVA